jgi:hypothetical protein
MVCEDELECTNITTLIIIDTLINHHTASVVMENAL